MYTDKLLLFAPSVLAVAGIAAWAQLHASHRILPPATPALQAVTLTKEPDNSILRMNHAQANLDATRASLEDAVNKSNTEISSAEGIRNGATQELETLEASARDTRVKLDEQLKAFDQGLISKEGRNSAQAALDTAMDRIHVVQTQLKIAENEILAAGAQREIALAQLALVDELSMEELALHKDTGRLPDFIPVISVPVPSEVNARAQ